jgi:large subunit ribosomal protein L31e
MADKQEKELERIYTIPLRKTKTSPRNHRADRAVKAVKTYLSKHMKSEEVWIDASVNELLWSRGMYQIPSKIRVRALKFDDGVVEVTLPEAEVSTSKRAEIQKRREDKESEKEEKASKKEKTDDKEAKKEWLAQGPPVLEIEGIGPVYSEKLSTIGIKTTRQLKEADAAEVAKKTDAPEGSVHQWQSMAELLEIKGVGKQFAELLVRTGVHTTKELARSEPELLLAKIEKVETGREKRIQGSTITLDLVKGWVDAAKAGTKDAWVKKADAESEKKDEKPPAAKKPSASTDKGAKAAGESKPKPKKE